MSNSASLCCSNLSCWATTFEKEENLFLLLIHKDEKYLEMQSIIFEKNYFLPVSCTLHPLLLFLVLKSQVFYLDLSVDNKGYK